MTALAVLAAAALVYALASRRLESSVISAPMFFVGVVMASVVLHGLSAPLLARAYARRVQRMTADAPELS